MTLTSASLKEGNMATMNQIVGPNEKKLGRSLSFQNWESEEPQLPDSIHSGKSVSGKLNLPCLSHQTLQKTTKLTISLPEPMVIFSPKPSNELNAAATKLQKVYKSYRTRRNLADCAVVVEELWWKALDFAALRRSSVSFFDVKKTETALSRWTRAMTRVAKVGKGLSKDEKAQKLALQHWLEAIDPRHRYGHNLHLYYDVWSNTRNTQPFFYWLDVGDGKELNIHSCPRALLQRQCITYLGPKEREAYEVIVEGGKLLYRQNGVLLNTAEGTKWIFVLSTSRTLYVGQKKKGVFQHSSFLSGAAITAAGRLVAFDGALEAIWPYSGHYLPTEENFKEFIAFLDGNNVDLTRVQTCAIDDDYSSPELSSEDSMNDSSVNHANSDLSTSVADVVCVQQEHCSRGMGGAPIFEASKRMSCKWSSGLGPRIGCVREYPLELQSQALEQVNLSPLIHGRAAGCTPIPSPRPSPRILVSPRLAYMGLPTS